MGEHMRFWLSLPVLCLFLPGCKDRDATPQLPSDAPLPIATDAELNGRLSGTWIFEQDFRLSHFRSVTTVTSNGSYVCQITFARSNATDLFNLEGRWQVSNGWLMDTIVKHSYTNMHLHTPPANAFSERMTMSW
jgi:hypothetical protein